MKRVLNRVLAEKRRNESLGWTQEAHDVWEELLDPRRTSLREWMESFHIPMKRVDEKTGTNMTQFVLRKAQARLVNFVTECWNRGEGAKVIVLKDRQQGISSCIEALMFERMMRGGGGQGRTVSHKDAATEDLLRILMSFRLQVPDFVFQRVMGAEWKSEVPDAMEFRVGSSIHRLETMTARDKAMGRGSAPRWLHISEYPWWDAGKGSLGAALEAWEDAPGNFCIIESTGKDFDEFYDLCVSAQEGRSPYTLFFYSWLDHPEKTKAFASTLARAEFVKTVGFLPRYGQKEERELVEVYKATPEQLHWRRRKIDSPDTPGASLQHFAREHPTKFSDAFLAESSCPFEPMEWLHGRRTSLLDMEINSEKGEFEASDSKGTKVEFVPNRNGRWTIYARPVEGRSYAWGCDPSSGAKFMDQGKRVADYGVIEVRDVQTRQLMAKMRDHLVPERISVEIMCASKFYGWARGYAERNNDGKVVVRELEGLQDAWGVPTEILLSQRRLIPTRSGDVWEHFPGFNTDAKTKPMLVNNVKRLMREIGPPKDGEVQRLSLGLMEEMCRYAAVQTQDKNGKPTGKVRYEASTGFDDQVMGCALTLEACFWLEERAEERTKYEGKGAFTFERYQKMLYDAATKPMRSGDVADEALGPMF